MATAGLLSGLNTKHFAGNSSEHVALLDENFCSTLEVKRISRRNFSFLLQDSPIDTRMY